MAVIEQKIKWHKATEAPQKNRPIYLLFKVGKRKYPLCRLMTFHNDGVVPAECDFGKTETKESQLPILWTYADQIAPVITSKVLAAAVAEAEAAAWAWYKKED